MTHRVKKVEWLSDYTLKIVFSSGQTKKVDLTPLLKNARNMFLELKNIDYFKTVQCDGYSISWPNGIDVCPDVLYSMGKPIRNVKSRSTLRNKSNAKSL